MRVAKSYTDDLRYLVEELLWERGRLLDDLFADYMLLRDASAKGAPAEIVFAKGASAEKLSAEDLWGMFRALANTRDPEPVSADFLEVQDRVLQGLIGDIGITEAKTLSRSVADDRLSIWRGDITTLSADAVVNAANSRMLGCWRVGHGCIDNAIHTFSGVQLRLECARLMAAQGHEEPVGRAKVTDAYNLPARLIIHTVGPMIAASSSHLRETDPDAPNLPAEHAEARLASCYRSCLEAAAERGCHTIAFCCISTGVFGFPRERAAHIAVATVRDWLDEYAGGSGRVVPVHSGPVAVEHAKGPVAVEDAAVPDLQVVFDVFSGEDEAIYHELLG